MIQVTGLAGLLILALDIWAIAKLINADITTGRRIMWVLLVVAFPVIGFIVWLLAGPNSPAK